MESVWLNDNKIITEDNKIILCSECPCLGCEVIPSTQINDSGSIDTTYPYRVKIAHMSAKSRDGAIYAYGYANNCLEFVGNGITLWYNPCATVNGKMCSVPKDTDVDIYLWDYAYPFIVWDGVFYYCIGDSTPL